MSTIRSSLISLLPYFLISFLAFALPACSEDLPDYSRKPVQYPYSRSAPNSEVVGTPTHSVPLLTIDLPNDKNGSPTVHTVADDLPAFAARLAATQSASRPAAAPPNPAPPFK